MHEKIYQKFLDYAVPIVKNLRLGNGMEEHVDVGPLCMASQVEIVERMVNEATAAGAKVLAGGKRSSLGEHYYEPTIVVDATADMNIVKEETFGPVMLVIKFSSDEEVVEAINASEFGLGASVFSTNYPRALKLAGSIESGMVSINEWGLGALVGSLPFGGIKLSGGGRFAGIEGLRDFCRVQSVVCDRWPLVSKTPSVLSYPYPENGPYFLSALIEVIYAPGTKKFAALGKLFNVLRGNHPKLKSQ